MTAIRQYKRCIVNRMWRNSILLPLLLLAINACIGQQPAAGLGARERQEPSVERETERKPMAGGFSEIPVDDRAALETYAFLQEELRVTRPEVLLGAVKEAARQIVAGTNIRLTCHYQILPHTEDHELTAVVYTDLSGNRRLRRIEFLGTGE